MSYTALDSEAVMSSVFREGPVVWAVWTAILATKDKDGLTSLNQHFLAAQWRIPVEEVQKAWDVLAKADPASKNPDHEGRRIVPAFDVAPGMWRVVSHDVYLQKWKNERRRESNRESQARARAKKRPTCDWDEGCKKSKAVRSKYCPEHTILVEQEKEEEVPF